MRKRRPNHRLVKIHLNYRVEEAARLLGTHKNTVRAWVKAGLPTCDSNRPTLILGSDFAHISRRAGPRTSGPASPVKFTASMPRAKAARRGHGGLHSRSRRLWET